MSRRDDSSKPFIQGLDSGCWLYRDDGRLHSVNTAEAQESQQQIAWGWGERHRQVPGIEGMLLGESRGAVVYAHESGQSGAGLRIISLKGRVDLVVLLRHVQMALAAFRTESKLLSVA